MDYKDLFFTDSAPGDATRPAVLMLHGFFMDHRLFVHQEASLRATHRVVAVDLPGFGKSVKPVEPFSLYDVVDALFKLMDSLDIERFTVMGMSMGGYLALRMALVHPDRIASMVLISTQAGKDNPETVAGYMALRENWANEEARKAIIENLLPVIIGPFEEEVAFWRPVWLAYGPEAIGEPMNAMCTRDDIDVTGLTMPALVIHGGDDHGIPIEAARKMADDLPNARFVMVPGGCHACNLTHHDIVDKAVVEFLDVD